MKTLERIKVATASQFPKGLGKTITIGAHEIALFRLTNGEFWAIENRCPHKGGVLVEGLVSGEHVFCPMHDWKINLSNGEVQKPDNGCVKTYPIKVINDDVFIVL